MHKGAKSAKWPTHWWYFSGPVDETKERPVTRERCFLDLIFLVDSNKDQLMFRSPSFLHIFAFAAAGSNVLVVVSHALMMHWPFRIISRIRIDDLDSKSLKPLSCRISWYHDDNMIPILCCFDSATVESLLGFSFWAKPKCHWVNHPFSA